MLWVMEQMYSTIEKECLAIKLGVASAAFVSMYLFGRPFSIEIDHCSLVWMETHEQLVGLMEPGPPTLATSSVFSTG